MLGKSEEKQSGVRRFLYLQVKLFKNENMLYFKFIYPNEFWNWVFIFRFCLSC